MPRPRNPGRHIAGATYYQGRPCKYGHSGERYASTGACRECIRLRDQARRPSTDSFDDLLKGE